jgi:hypothetical protein
MTRRAEVARRKGNIARKRVPGPVWYKKSKEVGRSGGQPPRVSEDEEEDTSHDWNPWETVTRPSGNPWDWSSGSEHSEFQAGYEEGGIGPCGGLYPLRNEKKAVRRGAGNVKAPAPTTTDRKREDFASSALGRKGTVIHG